MFAASLVTVIGVSASSVSASSVSAPVTGTVSGRLTTPGGEGVAGATVVLNDSTWWPQGITDAYGYYAITGSLPDRFTVRFSLPQRPFQYAYGRTSFMAANWFTLAEGGTVTVNDTLLPVGRIAGQLSRAGGEPVIGGWVSATATTLSTPGGSSTIGYMGDYSIPVFPGDYHVCFHTDVAEQCAVGAPDVYGADIISVAADQTVTVNDTLREAGPVTGRVVTATGQPVAGAYVRAVGIQERQPSAWTDESGYYSIPLLFPGDYRIMVTLMPTEAAIYAPQSRTPGGAQVYSIAEGEQQNVDITLLPTGTVAGRVTVDGVGLWDGIVLLEGEFGFGGSARANTNGDYVIDNVFAERYKIHFVHHIEGVDQWASGKASQIRADVFTVTAGTTLIVNETQPSSTGTLRVTARDAATGAPIQQFWAFCDTVQGLTDNGVLVASGILEGEYRLTAEAPGFGPQQFDVKIEAGRETEVKLKLHPLGSVEVTVVDSAAGTPLQGVTITASPRDRATIVGDGGYTDDQGKARLYLPAGSYNLMATPDRSTGYGIQWVGASAGTGDQQEAAVVSVLAGRRTTGPTIHLDPAGTITGAVTSQTGQPLHGGGVDVLTSSPMRTSYQQAPIGKNGYYRLEGLGPYRWPLLLSADGHADQWSGAQASRFNAYKVPVASGATTVYNTVMQVGTTISGTIRDPDGFSPQGWLTAYNAETGDFAAKTDTPRHDPYRLLAMPGQQIRMSIYPPHLSTMSFDSPRIVPVGTRPIELNLCVSEPSILRTCRAH